MVTNGEHRCNCGVINMTNFRSPAQRQVAYLVYTVVAVIRGALGVASPPKVGPAGVVNVGEAVLSYLGGALGFTAASNVKPDLPGQEHATVRPEVGRTC
jgi:hypothetical protein